MRLVFEEMDWVELPAGTIGLTDTWNARTEAWVIVGSNMRPDILSLAVPELGLTTVGTRTESGIVSTTLFFRPSLALSFGLRMVLRTWPVSRTGCVSTVMESPPPH